MSSFDNRNPEEGNMLHTSWLVLVVAGSLCLATASADDKEDAARKKELTRLEGVWTVSEARHGGKAVEQSEPETFEFKGGKLIVRKGNRAPITLTLRLDLSTNPRLMDWTTDPKGKFDDTDKFAEGIYNLAGDKLTVCYNVRDNRFAKGNRPTEFKSAKGSNATLVVLERSKK
jgi:uncharacterized protein (TIGR03067 family)